MADIPAAFKEGDRVRMSEEHYGHFTESPATIVKVLQDDDWETGGVTWSYLLAFDEAEEWMYNGDDYTSLEHNKWFVWERKLESAGPPEPMPEVETWWAR